MIYKCGICGYLYDEETEGKRWDQLDEEWVCPFCTASKSIFSCADEPSVPANNDNASARLRRNDEIETAMDLIHEMAAEGKSRIDAMRTQKPIINFDDVLIMGGQLANPPLLDDEEVCTQTIIGSHALKPMVLDHAVYISHMSFGALSKEAKTALAIGSSAVKTAECGGEGGVLKEEKAHAYQYIFEYIPNKYSLTDENLQTSGAIEIKIGQGCKPGMGGHLPADKVTEEIAAVRGKPMGMDIHSPSRFSEINTKEDLKHLVDELRQRSLGRPIGINIAAGHIEKDLEWIKAANPDFITIDGRGGATGASPKYLKDNTSVPTLFALARARAYMDAHDMPQELIITGGFRTSGDIVKALAMGADAVAIATAAMMALGCQQYRICHNGKCPMGIATQDEQLRKRLDVDKSAKQVENFLSALREELKSFARICGHRSIHDFSIEDLATTNSEISAHTKIKHV
ncbi:MAG TPA: FMN-binding glutamate synthase family protein [Dielma fastidiosa]|nr:FMN-binding glutamate synthase family protein [Dielma fastidiosa]